MQGQRVKGMILERARETRWAHLLSGAPATATVPAVAPQPAAGSVVAPAELAALKESVRRLEDELDALKRQVAMLREEHGNEG